LFKSGKKAELVFSICRIRQFTETTECLQDEIIVFVNKIVKIIHECTRRWDGKPTKNFGERYLLTWRVPSYSDAVDMVKAENADANINLD
jgi:class 3 adenylate cyclase